MIISVTPNATPTFTQVASICSGTALSPLPTTSNNSITGTWSPALNTTATTAYTFTPAPNQCATNQIMIIPVTPNTTPTFMQVASICSGTPLSPLPTTSNNSITGTWSPSLNTAATTTYTFTPALNQCATNQIMTISVTPNVVPIFTIKDEICMGISTFSLPNISNNGVLGSWYPQNVVTNFEGISNYIFTPTNQDCTASSNIEIKIIYCDLQKGISPHAASIGDGLNDYFKLSCIKFQIFNRYGMLVYSKDNYHNDWYGQTNKGEILPDATYYYIIHSVNNEIKTGWVYINSEK
jgi:gliding motility-associated-like protein